MSEKTTRELITEVLERRPEVKPSDMRNALSDYKISLTPDEIVEEIKEINRKESITVHVAPPECKDCGFDNWGELANIPSKCPQCRSEWIKEPRFTIPS